MKQLPSKASKIKNNRGMMTADFIFSLVLAAGISIVLFAMTFTLSMVEVAQYFAFASARTMSGADVSPDQQRQSALSKYDSLIKNRTFSSLFSKSEGSWFQLGDLQVGIEKDAFRDNYGEGDTNYDPRRSFFSGVKFDFTPKLLSLRIAFLGSTTAGGDASQLRTTINAIMLREPTFKECMDEFVNKRYDMIVQMGSSKESNRYLSYQRYANDYVPLEDNGC